MPEQTAEPKISTTRDQNADNFKPSLTTNQNSNQEEKKPRAPVWNNPQKIEEALRLYTSGLEQSQKSIENDATQRLQKQVSEAAARIRAREMREKEILRRLAERDAKTEEKIYQEAYEGAQLVTEGQEDTIRKQAQKQSAEAAARIRARETEERTLKEARNKSSILRRASGFLRGVGTTMKRMLVGEKIPQPTRSGLTMPTGSTRPVPKPGTNL